MHGVAPRRPPCPLVRIAVVEARVRDRDGCLDAGARRSGGRRRHRRKIVGGRAAGKQRHRYQGRQPPHRPSVRPHRAALVANHFSLQCRIECKSPHSTPAPVFFAFRHHPLWLIFGISRSTGCDICVRNGGKSKAKTAKRGQERPMRMILKIGKWLLALVIFALAALAGWLYQSPPELVRVASGYSAKIVCSNVFLAGRDPDEVLAIDVQAPGHWLLGYMNVQVDRDSPDGEGRAVRHVRQGAGGRPRRFWLHVSAGRRCRGRPAGARTASRASAAPMPSGRKATASSRRKTRQSPRSSTTASSPGPACAPWSWSRTAASSASATAKAFRPRRRCSAGR